MLCSRNLHKLEELRAALPEWTIELLAADAYPPEDGDTYYANARRKALFGRGVAPKGAWVLGEDSGIEVDALGGEPGVRSARWAAEGRQDVALLERLAGRGLDEPDRLRQRPDLVGQELHIAVGAHAAASFALPSRSTLSRATGSETY